jgi:hypothetical protein
MTIRVFVGCSANGEDAEAQGMLEYTIRRYAREDVEINWMKLSRDPASPWYANSELRSTICGTSRTRTVRRSWRRTRRPTA